MNVQDGKHHPCNVCPNHVETCEGCIFDPPFRGSSCENTECFLNYDGGCLIHMDEKCKASTCYKEELEEEEDEGE